MANQHLYHDCAVQQSVSTSSSLTPVTPKSHVLICQYRQKLVNVYNDKGFYTDCNVMCNVNQAIIYSRCSLSCWLSKMMLLMVNGIMLVELCVLNIFSSCPFKLLLCYISNRSIVLFTPIHNRTKKMEQDGQINKTNKMYTAAATDNELWTFCQCKCSLLSFRLQSY